MYVSNVRYAPNGVAEYTLMLILLTARNFKEAMLRANVNDYSLTGLMGRELRNMTIGVLGTGRIGTQVINYLRGFGCRIVAYDPYPNLELQNTITYLSLDDIYQQSDILTLHLPMSDAMYHVINDEAIAKRKPDIIIINTARGALIDAEALIKGIESRKIGALGLDVFGNESGIYHRDRRLDRLDNRAMAYLRQFPNVIMSQHMVFYTAEDVEMMVVQSLDNLQALEQGTSRSEF